MTLPPFQDFFDSHRSDVFHFLLARVGPESAEDCFQETFLAALRAYPDLRSGSNLRAWVLTIARNKAIDAHRRGVRTAALPLDEVAAPAAPTRVSAVEVWEPVAALPTKAAPGRRLPLPRRPRLRRGRAPLWGPRSRRRAATSTRV